MDNIIEFPARASEPTVLEFEIGIGSVDEARRTLECLEATVAVGLDLCGKAESEAKILDCIAYSLHSTRCSCVIVASSRCARCPNLTGTRPAPRSRARGRPSPPGLFSAGF
jgi:hypothetical protein